MKSYVTAQVSRYFNASPERIFDAWADFETMRKETSVVRIDLRVGGKWYVKDHREGMDFVADGEFLEIARPRRLVLTFRMEQFSPDIDRITIEIVPVDKGCQLTLTQEVTVEHEDTLSPQEVEALLAENKLQTEQGWTIAFDELEAKVAA